MTTNNNNNKVLLSNVETLTFVQGSETKARRSSPIPQLNCVKGDACGLFEPRAIQCRNQGSDGYDVQWKCTTDLPQFYELGPFSVSCEGYSHPDDPYVLRGSCGLEYSLYLTEEGRNRFSQRRHENSNKQEANEKDGGIWPLILVCILIFFLYRWLTRTTSSSGNYAASASNDADNDPPPPPYNPHYPSDDSYNYQSRPGNGSGFWGKSRGSTTSSGFFSGSGGFFTGLGLGGILGSMASSSSSSRRNQRQFHENSGSSSSRDRYQSTSSSSSESRSRESSSFGGTKRR